MASSKEMLPTARPLTHRSPIPNAPLAAGALSPGSSSSLASRQTHARTGSHSIIGAALNANHRVSRRKSMTGSGATNVAAVAAMIQEAEALPIPSAAASGRRHTMHKAGSGALSASPGHVHRAPSSMAAAIAIANGAMGSIPLPSPPASLPSRKYITADGSAIDDDANEMSEGDDDAALHKDVGSAPFDIALIRRASDGQPLVKEGRRSSRMDLRCDKCGKGYKHSSCLTKHLWEHTPEWSYTSKLLISKHQQVQLLEAASVLVAMTNKNADMDGVSATPPDSSRDFASERASVSSVASPYSDRNDGRSSAGTTPPPQMEGSMDMDGAKWETSPDASSPPASLTAEYRSFSQRFASGSGIGNISRSYQSGLPRGSAAGRTVASSGSVAGSGFPFGHRHRLNRDGARPPSSGKNATGQEDNELAAAVEQLSCSFNSAGGDMNERLRNMPPVPFVPAQYLGQTPTLDDTSFINSFPSRMPESFTRGERLCVDMADDIMMEESSGSLADDDDYDVRSRARSDDDDDGVFGRMEE